MTSTDMTVFQPIANLEHSGAIIGGVGLQLPPDLDYETYEAIGRGLWLARESIQFFIGDWIVYGEETYGDDIYTQAAAMTGAADQTLLNWASISRNLPPQRRRPIHQVKYSVQAEVAKHDMRAADQKRILKQAETEGLTKLQVRDLVREAKGETNHRQEVVQDMCPHCGRPM